MEQQQTFTPEQLKKQRRVIMNILLSGDAENHRKLREAKEDPELHPEIRQLIIQCERDVQVALIVSRR